MRDAMKAADKAGRFDGGTGFDPISLHSEYHPSEDRTPSQKILYVTEGRAFLLDLKGTASALEKIK